MKNIAVNFEDLTQEVVDAIAEQYPNGFIDSDLIRFSHLNNDLEERIKLIIGDTAYLVKKSSFEDWKGAKYEKGYFKTLDTEDPASDIDV